MRSAFPIALVAYQILVGDQLSYSVHLFAVAILAASFLLIRSSRRAYRRTLVDLMHEEGDALVDAVVSSLLASALVWQFGMIDNYSRGVSLLYLVSLLFCIALSRPLIRQLLTRMAARGAIEQRIAFYGADPQSVADDQAPARLARPPASAVRRVSRTTGPRSTHSTISIDRRL